MSAVASTSALRLEDHVDPPPTFFSNWPSLAQPILGIDGLSAEADMNILDFLLPPPTPLETLNSLTASFLSQPGLIHPDLIVFPFVVRAKTKYATINPGELWYEKGDTVEILGVSREQGWLIGSKATRGGDEKVVGCVWSPSFIHIPHLSSSIKPPPVFYPQQSGTDVHFEDAISSFIAGQKQDLFSIPPTSMTESTELVALSMDRQVASSAQSFETTSAFRDVSSSDTPNSSHSVNSPPATPSSQPRPPPTPIIRSTSPKSPRSSLYAKLPTNWKIQDDYEYKNGQWHCRSQKCRAINGVPGRVRPYGVYSSSVSDTSKIMKRAQEHSIQHLEASKGSFSPASIDG